MEDIRWLDGQEMRIWRGYLQAVARIDAALNDGLKQAGQMSVDDYEVLVHLSESPDRRLRMTELSHRILNSQSRLSQRVDRLVKRGLIARERCEEDGRGMFACLTDDGFSLLEAIAPSHLNDVRRLLIDRIEPAERVLLAEVFARLANDPVSDLDGQA